MHTLSYCTVLYCASQMLSFFTNCSQDPPLTKRLQLAWNRPCGVSEVCLYGRSLGRKDGTIRVIQETLMWDHLYRCGQAKGNQQEMVGSPGASKSGELLLLPS